VVCLSVTFVYCAQTAEYIDTISFAYDSPISLSLSDRVKIWLTSVNPFLPKFCHKVTYPCLFERRRHSMTNCGWMVRDSAMVTMESYYKTTIALSNGTISYPPSPKIGVPSAPPDELRDACCHLANMTEDIDKAAVFCGGCHDERSDVPFGQITLHALCFCDALVPVFNNCAAQCMHYDCITLYVKNVGVTDVGLFSKQKLK